MSNSQHGKRVQGKEKLYVSDSKRVSVNVDEGFVNKVEEFVKKQRDRVIQPGEMCDILLLQSKMRLEENQRRTKNGKGRKTSARDITREIAALLNRSNELVGDVWRNYITNHSITVASPRGSNCNHPCRVPMSRKATLLVQSFVRNRNQRHERTVAKDVLDLLKSEGIIEINRSDSNNSDYKAALRSVQRFLTRIGYKRGSRKGIITYRMKQHITSQRDQYVKKMISLDTRRVVYTDESYIHHNYSRHRDSLYDPNDEQDLQVIWRHKGRRYCFIAAIIDENKDVRRELQTDNDKAHLLKDTLDIFEGGRQTKDYHGMFNSSYYVKWMEELLKCLKNKGITNTVIVMDNAKYHKALPPDTPRQGNNKKELQAACKQYNINFDETDTKAMLWQKLAVYIEQNVVPVVCEMAKIEGHEVVFTPPHYSDLQPIETVWAIVKGEVGIQYNIGTTFQMVLDRLNNAFNKLSSYSVQGCINKANKRLKELCAEIKLEDEKTDGNSGDDFDSDEDNGSFSSNTDNYSSYENVDV